MRDIDLIEVSGDARTRGEQYGETARAKIEQAIAFYSEAFVAHSAISWTEVTDRAKLWMPLVEQFAPDLLEEMHGIAAGADVTPLDILALNARGDIVHDRAFASVDPAQEEGCSSYALLPGASGDGKVYCGQNWDWLAGVQDTTVALRIHQPPKPTVITIVEAGQVGRQGANSAGIAVNANGLGGRFDNSIGVPQTFIRRRILDSASFGQALQVPTSVRQQIAANLLLTHAEGVAIDLETTPGRHRWLHPEDDLLVHTNHYIDWVPEQLRASYRPTSPSSLYRLPLLHKGLSRCRDTADSAETVKVIADSLRNHFGYPNALCCHPDQDEVPLKQSQTLTSSIVDLTDGVFWVTQGPPCKADFTALPWNIYTTA